MVSYQPLNFMPPIHQDPNMLLCPTMSLWYHHDHIFKGRHKGKLFEEHPITQHENGKLQSAKCIKIMTTKKELEWALCPSWVMLVVVHQTFYIEWKVCYDT